MVRIYAICGQSNTLLCLSWLIFTVRTHAICKSRLYPRIYNLWVRLNFKLSSKVKSAEAAVDPSKNLKGSIKKGAGNPRRLLGSSDGSSKSSGTPALLLVSISHSDGAAKDVGSELCSLTSTTSILLLTSSIDLLLTSSIDKVP